MSWTVYCHTHAESGRRYIGLTKQTMERRWAEHVSKAKSAKGGRWHFPNAIRKYGKNAFAHDILAVCETLEEANRIEQDKIEEFRTRDPRFGFNLAEGGQHKPHSIRKNPWDDTEYRANMQRLARERWEDPSYRGRAVASSQSQWTPEYRAEHLSRFIAAGQTAAARAANRVALNSPESKARMSVATKASNSRPEVKAKLVAANLGKVVSADTRRKISDANRNRPLKTHCKHGHSLEDAYQNHGLRRSRVCRGLEFAKYRK